MACSTCDNLAEAIKKEKDINQKNLFKLELNDHIEKMVINISIQFAMLILIYAVFM